VRLVLHEGDTLARFGGDKFVAVSTDLAEVEDCKLALERLLWAELEPAALDDIKYISQYWRHPLSAR
jgi:GGDEF domain-containing protein